MSAVARAPLPAPAAPAALIALIATAAILRWAAVTTVGDTPALRGDEVYYVEAARSLARGLGFPDSARPPAFPFLLSLAFRCGGESLLVARLAQAAVSVLAVVLVFDLVRLAFGTRPAFLSGLACAAHPTLVHYGHFLWAETLYTTLLLSVFWSLQRFARSTRLSWVAAAGLGLGLAALTREMALYFLPLVLFWLWRQPAPDARARAMRVATALLVCALVVLPWTARNYARHGRLVVVSTLRWLPVAQGNLLPERGWLFGPSPDPGLVARYLSIPDEFEREALARGIAQRAIAEQQPSWVFRKTVRNTFLLFRPVSQLSKFLGSGWLRPEEVPLARRLAVVEWIGYVALTGLGLVALWLVPHPGVKPLIAGYVVFSWALYVFANANHRFRVPLLPLLAVYVGPLVCGLAARPAPRWRRAGAGLCVAAFLAVVTADAFRRSAWQPDDDTALRHEDPAQNKGGAGAISAGAA